MAKMKKGILSSLSVLLVMSAILLLLVAISKFNYSNIVTNSENAQFEKANMQYDSAANSMRSLLLNEGVNISISTSNITFLENTSRIPNYSMDVARLKSFLESYYTQSNLSINISDAQRPKMYIYPQNISVDHSTNNIIFTPLNTNASVGNLTGYSINLSLAAPDLYLNWTILSNVSQSNPNALYFSIETSGTNNTVSDIQYLNKQAASTLIIQSGSNNIATITFGAPGTMNINYGIEANLNTTVSMNSNISQVELGTNIINITGDVQKVDKVIVSAG